MNKRLILTAAFFGTLAVILGAFGAHGLKSLITPEKLSIWQKGVEYQFYHTFALLYLSTFARYKNRLISFSFTFFVIGIVFFSGSLYVLALRDAYQLNLPNSVGIITPIGGMFFIFGWVSLFLAALKDK